jgi:hypothetical protein
MGSNRSFGCSRERSGIKDWQISMSRAGRGKGAHADRAREVLRRTGIYSHSNSLSLSLSLSLSYSTTRRKNTVRTAGDAFAQ